MFFTIPIGTDAPLYHWPFATGGMILLNVVILILQTMMPDVAEGLVLQFGTINPIQWVSAMLMHQDFGHLIGNMIGLALFGWVVEGKVGWWRFLLICFGIGICANAFTQFVMFFAEGGALGFSGVVFGLIAVALVWAPENHIHMLFCGMFFFRPFAINFDVSISTLAFIMLAMEFLIASLSGFSMSTEILHLIGAAPGFVIAYFMIRWRRVDCDGFDLVSLMKGKRGERVMTIADEKSEAEAVEVEKLATRDRLQTGLEKVQLYIDQGHYDLAVSRFGMLKKSNHAMKMREEQYVTLIKHYDSQEATKTKTIPLLKSYLEHYDRFRAPFTLMLARVHVLIQDRPRQGIKVLKTLEWSDLNPKQKEFVRQLLDRAKKMIADGVLEVNE
ncbi:MAG: membrane associated rhomboid family serine protease [Mariniblastus sp.]|jgi:membrane associated rhomboid family serine protease